jgi:two-component system OmpR family response regulator
MWNTLCLCWSDLTGLASTVSDWYNVPTSSGLSVAQILVVDDEPDTLGLIELTLKTAGHSVKSTASGAEAMRLISRGGHDLVILDVMMPDMSGFDVLRALRNEKASIPPIIILSAKNLPEDRETGMSLGATAFLIKPATRGGLLDAVQEALES